MPAKLLGVDALLGTIAPGKFANLTVVEGELFDEKAVVRDVWVGGVRHVVNRREDAGLDGAWRLTAGWPGELLPTLQIDGKKVKLTIGDDKAEVADVRREPTTLACRNRRARKPMHAAQRRETIACGRRSVAGCPRTSSASSTA